MRRGLAAGVLASLVTSGVAWHAAVLQGQGPSAERTAGTVEAALDASKLGVSLDRIRARLIVGGALASAFDPARLKLSTYVEVAAKAPPFRLFGPEAIINLGSRAVSGGPPTTREMLDVVKERRR